MVTIAGAVAAAPHQGVPHLQFRPVLASIAPDTTAPVKADASPDQAVASCDTQAVSALGSAAPSTKLAAVTPDTCVVLSSKDGSTRYLLGTSALDATSVKRARATFQSGIGWTVVLTLNPAGAQAFDALLLAQFHHQIAIVTDGVVVTAPVIEPASQAFSSFDGIAQISAGLTSGEAQRLAKSINGWRRAG
jgi:preprotein translocase subunit SecD